MGPRNSKTHSVDDMKKAQSSVEWFMGHAWSIVVVLTVASVLAYLGIFEGSARPRFEGLHAARVQPMPDQVQLYSDGVMIFTVMNNHPYSHKLEWVEVAPLLDKDDVIRTELNDVIKAGELKVYELDATNLLGGIYEASFIQLESVSAGQPLVDFNLCVRESYSAGGTDNSHIVCGRGMNIYVIEVEDEEEESWPPGCIGPCQCPCETNDDCPLACWACNREEPPGSCYGHCVDTCGPTFGWSFECQQTGTHPEGECIEP